MATDKDKGAVENNEIQIDIAILTEKRNGQQVDISDMFHLRFPSDDEFKTLGPMVDDLIQTEAKIEALETVLKSIESNALKAQREGRGE